MAAIGKIDISQRSRGAIRNTIYESLLEEITSGVLEPGRRISENELAERYGVSRTPIREAVSKLRNDYILEVVPQLGTFVAKISEEAVSDAQFIRESLECAAIKIAAQRVQPWQVEKLYLLIEDQERSVSRGELDQFYRLDNRFHRMICLIAERPIAWAVAQRADAHLNRVRRLSLPVPNYAEMMVSEHRDVVQAIASGDPDKAEAALRVHLTMVLSGLEDIKQANPEYFS